MLREPSGFLDVYVAKTVIYGNLCRILFGDRMESRRLAKFFFIMHQRCTPRWAYRVARALRDYEALSRNDATRFVWLMERALAQNPRNLLLREALTKQKRFRQAFRRSIFCHNCLHYETKRCPYQYQDLKQMMLPHVRCGRYKPYLSEVLYGALFLRLRHALYKKCPKTSPISLRNVVGSYSH